MTRPAVSARHLALILAGGSFFSLAVPAALAEDPALPAGVARLNIAPLRLELDAKKPTATVMLTNTSERPVPIQARLFAWSQENGEDRFEPSGALTISPSIISIAPGATQVVRLLRNGPATPGEKRFRLAVDQLPDPTMAQSGQAEARLRFTIPVFFDRDQASPARLDWKLGADRLEVVNQGGATSKLMSVEVTRAGGQPVAVTRNSLRYVQGNSTISWGVTGGCALGPVSITAQVDGQTVHAQASPTCG